MKNKSHLTAISRKKLSAPMDMLYWELDGGDLLDYGCGKGFDADHYGMDKYDPYYFPEKPDKKYDVITCNYVLCVLEEEEEQAVIDDVMSMLKPGGRAFFTVRRDKRNLNGWTSKMTYQRYVELDMEVWHEENNRYCIYTVQQTEGMIETHVKFTLRIKPEHNPKEFKKGLGAGVLMDCIATFRQTPEEAERDKDGIWLSLGINEYARNMLNDNVEVVYQEVSEDGS